MLNKETKCPSAKCNNEKARRMLDEKAKCLDVDYDNGKAKKRVNEKVRKNSEKSQMS